MTRSTARRAADHRAALSRVERFHNRPAPSYGLAEVWITTKGGCECGCGTCNDVEWVRPPLPAHLRRLGLYDEREWAALMESVVATADGHHCSYGLVTCWAIFLLFPMLLCACMVMEECYRARRDALEKLLNLAPDGTPLVTRGLRWTLIEQET